MSSRSENISSTSSAGLSKRRIVIRLTPNQSQNGSGEVWIGKDDENVNIAITLKRCYGGIDPSAKISIANVDPSIIRRYTTQVYCPENPARIDIWVGYQKYGEDEIELLSTSGVSESETVNSANNTSNRARLRKIFSGVIIWALPSSGRPDVVFSIIANERFFEYQNPVSFTPEKGRKYTPTEYIAEVAKLAGIDSVDDTALRNYDALAKEKLGENATDYFKKITPYSFCDKFYVFVYEWIGKFNNMTAVMSNGVLQLWPNSQDINFLMGNLINTNVVKRVAADSNIVMIGEPSPNPTGIEFTTLYTEDLAPMDMFIMDSRIFPDFSATVEGDSIKGSYGKYWVQQIIYNLTTREEPFYCDVMGRRIW